MRPWAGRSDGAGRPGRSWHAGQQRAGTIGLLSDAVALDLVEQRAARQPERFSRPGAIAPERRERLGDELALDVLERDPRSDASAISSRVRRGQWLGLALARQPKARRE